MSEINDISSNDLIIILDSILNKKKGLISHHVESINKFNESGIKQIMVNGFNIQVELNNERDSTDEDKLITKYLMKANITDVRLLPPVTINYDTQRSQILFPGEAHLKDLTYSSPMYIDADIVCTAYKSDGTTEIKKEQIQNYRLGSIPIMVGSKLCNSYNKSRDTLIELNEDPTDLGGYFIIKSNEWIIDSIESMTYNLSREFRNVGFKNELARSDIISKPGDNFENSSSLICKYLANGNINFEVTNNKFRDISIPFYVLFRAFGVCSDGEIIEHITYSMNDGDPTIKKMLNILEKGFQSSYTPISNAYQIHNQTEILELIGKHINDFYLSNLNTSNKNNVNTRKYNINNVLQILDKDILPHVGLTSDDRYKKIRFLGHLINRLLKVYLEIIPPTDRDSYKNKRINPAGVSYAKVFKTNFNFAIVQQLRRQFTKDLKATTFSNLNLKHSFETAIYGHEFERALIQAIVTGDKTININRKAVQNRLSSQQLHRKNQINVISALRNINTNNTSSAKQSARANEMRRFHSSMIGYVCCVQSADTGEKVGMQKQMAISAKISLGSSSDILKEIVLSDKDIILLDRKLTNLEIYTKKLTKVFVNGDWLGCCLDFASFSKKYREMRRNNKIHYLTTISFDVKTNELYFWVDIGRIARPLIIVYNNEEEYYKSNKTIEFKQHINLTKEHIINLNAGIINYETLLDDEVIEFISPEEQQNCLIAKDIETLNLHINDPLTRYTHLDISQAIIGIPGLTSPFSNHNQAARVVFQTNQVKQTCGIPCLNFPFKSYKEMHLQVYNQKPLVKTIANKYYAPIGMNSIVAVMIYGGYNQEDSLIVNQGAVDRGLFTTHHFTFEKTELEKNEEFTNPDPSVTADIKAYSNYDKLVNGVVPPGTYIESGDIIIGKIAKLNKADQYDNFKYYDKSIVYKYDEPAYVWDVIKGRNEEDNLFCKVIFRSARKVAIGDKFSSRSGQKGVVGISYRDSDMPYTEDGIKPDLIFNPHSLPSRMTMGVLFEGMASKANAINGTITDGTIFKKIDIDDLADDLAKVGYNRNGTERLYNGITGNYIDVEIFIGPIYYQRLQKFTVDTVYSHKTCPTDAITHQPLDGKSAKGGLRLGEMEKDVMAISSVKFLQEKFIDHSDVYHIYVCKKCNKRAVVNEKYQIYKCKYCADGSDIVKIKTSWSCKQMFDEIESCNIGVKLFPKENTYQRFE
jgi:DNA-directed RNA polymerase beta subunit